MFPLCKLISSDGGCSNRKLAHTGEGDRKNVSADHTDKRKGSGQERHRIFEGQASKLIKVEQAKQG